MSLCINPNCSKPTNSDKSLFCSACGSELLLAGRYRVLRLLSDKGGFGNTYEVIHHDTLKVLKVLTRNDQKAIELFEQEARILNELEHRGIPKGDNSFLYFPKNSQTPIHCLVMEKIEGLDLEEYQEQRSYRPIDQKLALEWLIQLVEILDVVHSHQFFHRDIKPSNIILRVDGQLTLIDFGAVRQVTRTIVSGGMSTGIYTPGYAPPEQQQGYGIMQSDFYALGRTFVYLLTGRHPTDPAIYDFNTDQLSWRNQVSNTIPALLDLIDQLMSRSANERPSNTKEILKRLEEISKMIRTPTPQSSPKTSDFSQETILSATPSPPLDRSRRKFIKGAIFGGIGLASASTFALIWYAIQHRDLIVSGDGKGDHKTINEAIQKIKPGKKIFVRPGTYQESLTLDKPVEIIGNGLVTDIIIESTDSNCITMNTDLATIKGLTLKCTAGTKNQYYAVDITQGQLTLEDCYITSNSLSCINVKGSSANPIIKGCRIYESQEAGILFLNNAQGTVENCEILGNSLSAVEISQGSNPTIR